MGTTPGVPPHISLLQSSLTSFPSFSCPFALLSWEKGWNSSSFPAHGFSTGQRDDFLGDAHPQTQQCPGAHHPWMFGITAPGKVPLKQCRVLHARSKQELPGWLEMGGKPQEDDQCSISNVCLSPSSSVIDASTPQVCPKTAPCSAQIPTSQILTSPGEISSPGVEEFGVMFTYKAGINSNLGQINPE